MCHYGVFFISPEGWYHQLLGMISTSPETSLVTQKDSWYRAFRARANALYQFASCMPEVTQHDPEGLPQVG